MRQIVIAVTLVIAVIVAVIITNPMRVTPDGESYLAAAQSFLDGRGFLDRSGEPMTLWTPGYPLLLAFLDARVISVASFVLCAWLLVTSTAVAWVGALRAGALIVWAFVDAPFRAVLSEVPFLPLLLLFLRLLDQPLKWVYMAAASAVAAAETMIRYVGIFVLAIPFFDFVQARSRQWLWRLVIIAAPAVILLALWVLRNYEIGGTLFGGRYEAGGGLINSVKIGVVKLMYWSPLLALPLLAAWRVKMRIDWHVVILAAVYFVIPVLSYAGIGMDPPTGRLLAPVFVLILVLFRDRESVGNHAN